MAKTKHEAMLEAQLEAMRVKYDARGAEIARLNERIANLKRELRSSSSGTAVTDSVVPDLSTTPRIAVSAAISAPKKRVHAPESDGKQRNRYAKRCAHCLGVVWPNDGFRTLKAGKWEVVHEECPSIVELMEEEEWCGVEDGW